jgi:hypothetical protein
VLDFDFGNGGKEEGKELMVSRYQSSTVHAFASKSLHEYSGSR